MCTYEIMAAVEPLTKDELLMHTEKALKDFLPVTQARHGAGRVIHTNLDYCQSLYISFIFAVLIIANFSVLRQITQFTAHKQKS